MSASMSRIGRVPPPRISYPMGVPRALTVLVLLAFLAVTAALGRPAAGDSTPYGQELYWNDNYGPPTGRQFGANQGIVIYQGSMAFVPGPICTGFDGGQNDFLYPVTDVYIVESGTVEDYGALEDVSGVPNTIFGVSSGLFIEERIGVAGGKFPPEFEELIGQLDEQLPSLVGEGTYDVVYDECQDGKFQPTIDALFEEAIVVTFGFDVAAFPSDELMLEKLAALATRDATTEFHDILEEMFDAGYAAASIENPAVKVIKELGTKTMYADPAAVTLQLYANLANHYNGIFADPPDPAFSQPTLLGPMAAPPARSSDPTRDALVGVAVAIETEARIAEALLHAMERYQGAEAVNDGKWALAQAKEIGRYAAALQGQLGEVEAALDATVAAVAADPSDLEAGAAELAALAADVAAGDDEALVREARNAGLDETRINELIADLIAADWASWQRTDVAAAVDELKARNDDLAAVLPGFASAMAGAVSILESNAGVQEPFPIADAGGPYAGTVGTPVALDASASLGGRLPVANYEIDLYEWDLDADGAFDDATGATPSVTFDRPFHGLLAVRVTNGLAEYGRHVAYARADIGTSNEAPDITSASPAADPTILIGAGQFFSVSASDPDGGVVTVRWIVDGTEVATGSSFTFAPSAVGPHAIEAVATDPEGAARTRSWLARASQADGDGDLWNANADCDDDDADRNPGLPEIVGNATDDDCDATTPDGGSPPVAGFLVDPVAPRPGEPVAFRDRSSDPNEDIVSWTWNFGDGASSSSASPTHTFSTKGTYDVTLTVTDLQGSSDSDTRSVTVSADPIAGFTFSPSVPAVGGEVEFTDTSTDDGTIGAWAWDFGDGVASTLQDPAHVFTIAGTYDVTLTVTDDDGLTGSATHQVVVGPADPGTAPTAAFAPESSFNLASSALGATVVASSGWCCTGHEPQVMLDANVGLPWATSNALSTHYATIVLAGGVALPIDRVQIQPRADNATYNSQRVKDFTIEVSTNGTTFTSVLTAQTVNDGTLQTFALPPGTTASHVRYRPTTNWGSTTNISTSRFTVLTRRIGPRTVTFSNLSANAVSYRWDFGDGSPTSSAEIPTHTFPAPGVYTVSLRVKAADGRIDTESMTYQAVGPFAAFDGDPSAPEAGEPVVLTDSSTDTLGGVTSWSWAFGDGTTSTNPSEVHTYAAAGTYQVRLTVSDAHGLSDTVTHALVVGTSASALPRPLFSPASVGENVAAASAGATILSFSSQYSPSFPTTQIIDGSASNGRWATASADANRYAIIDLAGDILEFDRIRIAPINTSERVKDFAVDVSTTGTASGDFTTVLEATAQNSDALQEFVLDAPTSARYVRLRLLSSQSGGAIVSVALFEVVGGGGTNLALLEAGASISAYSSSWANNPTYPTLLIDANLDPAAYWPTLSGQPLGWVKVDLAGSAPRQIERIRLMPRSGTEAVKDFEIAVSTSGTADSDFTTVLRATAANSTTLQEFLLPRPMLATALSYRIRSNYGSCCVTSTIALKALSGQVGGATVRFRNLSRDADSYVWDFGDGTTSTEANPTHSFAADGTYTVTLTATNANGSTAYTLDQVVESASFEWAPAEPGAGDAAIFTDTSPFLAEHVAWSWRFGDGSSSDATSPAKTYSAPGEYDASMLSLSPEGVTNVALGTVTVVPVTELRVLFRPVGGTNVASSEAGATVVSYTSRYDANHDPANMLDRNTTPDSTYRPWATGSGIKTGSAIVHLARGGSDGPYLVQAFGVMPRVGFAAQRVKRFEIAVSTTGTAPVDFTTVLTATAADNANLQVFALPKPVLARYVRYTVLDNRGDACCTSTARLTAMTGQVGGATVTFENLSLNAVSYVWDFGDGATSTETTPTHTFPGPGLYTVTLTATDSSGATKTFSVKQRVLAVPAPSFSRSIPSPTEGQAITFTSTTPATADGPIVESRWTWGDGTAQTVGTPISHTFVDDGMYTVRLTVIDAWEQQAFIEASVPVANVAPAVAAGADWQWREARRLRFNPTISDVGATDTWTCVWDYGDGGTGSGCTFDHTYPDSGDFSTLLTVTDSDGGVATDALHVKVIVAETAGGGGGGGGTGSGDVVVAADRTYTLDDDFERGTLLNVNHTDTVDALELNRTTSPFPFIWVAASARGTVLRIDVDSGAILGEYRTAPENRSKNPSRTTVDQYGNVWVTNRDEASTITIAGETTAWGSVARIGLIIGGDRVDATGAPNTSGEYLRAPFQYSTCVDRNGDGLIRTSRGRAHILGWPNTSGVDHDGGVETALDECIVIYTRVHGTNTRTVAIDANNDVWVGGANNVHEKLDSVSGERIPGTKFTKGCGGYGGLIDGHGVLWSARYGSGLLRYDTTTLVGACLGNGRGDYGLGIDPQTGNIWQTYLNGNRVVKLDPAGTELGRYAHGFDRAQGVAVDGSGNVWVTHSTDVGKTLGRVRTDGTFVGTVDLQPGFDVVTGLGPTGVSIDANGKPWVANLNSNNAQRIDPKIGRIGGTGLPIGYVDLTVDLGTGAGPYNYSDMTGFVAIGTASPQGFWSIVQDAGVLGAAWGAISWNGETPNGTSIGVEARSADTQTELAGTAFTIVANGSAGDLRGRFIEVRATLRTDDLAVSPRLDDIRIAAAEENLEPIAAIDAPTSVAEGSTISLDGSSSSDPDGDPLSFAWDLDDDGDYDDGIASTASVTPDDGPATVTVRLRVTDPSGASSESTTSVLVTNVAPTAALGNNGPIAEGGSASVSFTGPSDPSSDDTSAGFHYAFSCTNGDLSGATYADSDTLTSTSCPFSDNGSYTVKGRIIDKDGGFTESTTSVLVTNVAPTAAIFAPTTITEGSAFTISLVGPSDPSAVDTAAGFTYAFDCGTGSDFGTFSANPVVGCPAPTNDELLSVAAKIRDKDGGERTYDATVDVTNVSPTTSLSNDSPTPWGLSVGFEATASDPSADDVAGLTFEWDFNGDGTYDAGPFSDRTRTNVYPAPGSHPARVRVCDDDTCTSAETAVSITRRGTALLDQTSSSVQYSDPLTVRAALDDIDVTGPVIGRSVDLSAGPYGGSGTSDDAGISTATFVVGLPAGALAIHAEFAGDAYYESAAVDGSVEVLRERAIVAYSGDTFATGTQVRLAATVSEATDGSLGDIRLAFVTFDVYAGATACGSGNPTRYGPVAVADTGTPGDGSGTAEYAMSTPGEQTYCVVARLTGPLGADGRETTNPYYQAEQAQAAVLTVVSTTGKFATGGGWIVDPSTDGRGNFGFTARFTKAGAPKGQAVYVWRGLYGSVMADFIVKSNSITGLSFADERGNGTFPWRATMVGKATIRINRSSDGSELVTDGNATFTLVAVDSGTSSGIGVDTFAIRVLDKDGLEYKLVGSWSGSTYAEGILLSGGNVMVHLK